LPDCRKIFLEFELLKSVTPIYFKATFLNLIAGYPIYCNCEFEVEKFAHTRYGIWKIF
jgi:hypothetical protein